MRILLADDDDDVRQGLAKGLRMLGHEVTEARHGLQAMQIYAKAHRTVEEELGFAFDFVITDYQMPEKNGVVLIMDIRALNPEQKVVLVSADPPTLPAAVKKLTGEFPMLRKPYRLSDLLALLA